MQSNSRGTRTILILILFSIVFLSFRNHPQCRAQEVMERLRQFDVESVSFDLPCIVHFDISVQEESPTTGGIRSSRYLGRTIRLSDYQLRTEYLYEEFSPRAGMRELELYLQHSPEEKIVANVGATEFDYGFSSISYDKLTVGDGLKLRNANPYNFLISGAILIGGNAGGQRPLERILKNFVPLKGAENQVVRPGHPVVSRYEFDSKDPWKIVKFVSLFPRGGAMAIREYKKKIESVEDSKDLVPLISSEAKWIELANGVHVPYWIYHRRENLVATDPGRVEELEGFFFGIETDPKINEKLFEPDRITHEEWKKDFNIDQIEKLAKQEREKLLRKHN
jgi:hypothetical protein